MLVEKEECKPFYLISDYQKPNRRNTNSQHSLCCAGLSVRSSKPGVLNLLVPPYPQIKIVLLCVPPNQKYMPFAYPQIKNSAQKGFF